MKENKLCVGDMILKSKHYTPQSVRLQEEVAAARADAGRCLVERGEQQRRLELGIQERDERNADTSQQLDTVTKELESMKSKLSKCKT